MPLLITLNSDDADALTHTLDVAPASGRAATATRVALRDGPLALVEDFGGHQQCRWTAEVLVVVLGDDPEALGPTLNAAYAQLLAAVLADRTLGALVMDVAEISFRCDIDDTPNTAPTALGVLTLAVDWQRWGTGGPTLDAVRAALAAVLGGNTPQPESVREVLCQGLADLVRSATGLRTQRNGIRPTDLSDPASFRAFLTDGEHVVDPGQATYQTHYQLDVDITLCSALDDPTARDLELDTLDEALRAALGHRTAIAGVPVLVPEYSTEAVIDETDGGAPSSARTLRVTVQFQTDENDPTALPLAA